MTKFNIFCYSICISACIFYILIDYRVSPWTLLLCVLVALVNEKTNHIAYTEGEHDMKVKCTFISERFIATNPYISKIEDKDVGKSYWSGYREALNDLTRLIRNIK